MSVNDKAKELAAVIMTTREFAEVKQTKAIIDKSRDLKSKIEDFKRKEHSLYAAKLSSGEEQQKAQELRKAFESLSLIPEIGRYLNAEKAFNDLLQKAYRIIGETLESALKS